MARRFLGSRAEWVRPINRSSETQTIVTKTYETKQSSLTSLFVSFDSIIHDPSEIGIHPGIESVGMERMSEIAIEAETEAAGTAIGSGLAVQGSLRLASWGTNLATQGNDIIDEDLVANAYLMAKQSAPIVTPQPVAPVPISP